MIKGTIVEELLREAVKICFDEYQKVIEQGRRSPGGSAPKASADYEEHVVPRLFTVKEWVRVHGTPAEGGLRRLIFSASQNGFDKCVRRIGRRVLIHEDEFFKWIERTNSSDDVRHR